MLPFSIKNLQRDTKAQNSWTRRSGLGRVLHSYDNQRHAGDILEYGTEGSSGRKTRSEADGYDLNRDQSKEYRSGSVAGISAQYRKRVFN
jgi:hypothetical protein